MLVSKPANRYSRESDPVTGELLARVVQGQGTCPGPLCVNLVRVLRVP